MTHLAWLNVSSLNLGFPQLYLSFFIFSFLSYNLVIIIG